MGRRTVIPILCVGAVVLAAITDAVLNIPFRKDTWSILLVLAYLLPALFIAWLISRMIRKERIRDWCPAQGTIESCDKDYLERGIQNYRCAYVFCPDDTRQGGTFLISEGATDSDDRLDEIRNALVGYTVRVRYDPKDCTRCMVEDEKVLEWGVDND